ncbi:MAG: hypothetical protein HQL93_11060, partial [Magnetococcales bacterium]|nr:hypothetical protein [Magnetococcales bacterium]
AQLLVVLLLALGAGWFEFVLSPFNKEKTELQRQQVKAQASIREMEKLERDFLQRKEKNPDQLEQEKVITLKQEIARLDKKLGEGIVGMVSPAQMIQALKSLLSGDSGLTLLSLEAAPPKNLLGGSESRGEFYQHTLTLRFSGAFPDVLKYLHDLEALPWNFFWDGIQFVVVEHPKAYVTLKIHTLSLSEELLGGDS